MIFFHFSLRFLSLVIFICSIAALPVGENTADSISLYRRVYPAPPPGCVWYGGHLYYADNRGYPTTLVPQNQISRLYQPVAPPAPAHNPFSTLTGFSPAPGQPRRPTNGGGSAPAPQSQINPANHPIIDLSAYNIQSIKSVLRAPVEALLKAGKLTAGGIPVANLEVRSPELWGVKLQPGDHRVSDTAKLDRVITELKILAMTSADGSVTIGTDTAIKWFTFDSRGLHV